VAVPPVAERTVAVNGIDLHLAEAGPSDGPPVVLLHGFPDSWKRWRHQVDALAAAGHRVLAPDLRGFGSTTRPAEVGPTSSAPWSPTSPACSTCSGSAGRRWPATTGAPPSPGGWPCSPSDRVERLAVVSVGHPLAGVAAGLAQRRLSWYVLWFLYPGVAEEVLPAGDWALYRHWIWSGAQPGQDPDLDRQLADLTRPGALSVAGPTLGVWSSDDPTPPCPKPR
jgi:hypothetical protein